MTLPQAAFSALALVRHRALRSWRLGYEAQEAPKQVAVAEQDDSVPPELRIRRHSNLDYLAPLEFERKELVRLEVAGAKLVPVHQTGYRPHKPGLPHWRRPCSLGSTLITTLQRSSAC